MAEPRRVFGRRHLREVLSRRGIELERVQGCSGIQHRTWRGEQRRPECQPLTGHVVPVTRQGHAESPNACGIAAKPAQQSAVVVYHPGVGRRLSATVPAHVDAGLLIVRQTLDSQGGIERERRDP